MKESRQEPQESRESLGAALGSLLRHPVRSFALGWNWKSALVSALLRSGTFFAANHKAGGAAAARASATEALFAIFASGILGATTQRLRWAQPAWATALVIWLALPTAMVAAQSAVHHLSGTPHLKAGLIVSFCFASIASGFGWYAQRRGVLLAGERSSSLSEDVKALPRVIAGFVAAPFVEVWRKATTPSRTSS